MKVNWVTRDKSVLWFRSSLSTWQTKWIYLGTMVVSIYPYPVGDDRITSHPPPHPTRDSSTAKRNEDLPRELYCRISTRPVPLTLWRDPRKTTVPKCLGVDSFLLFKRKFYILYLVTKGLWLSVLLWFRGIITFLRTINLVVPSLEGRIVCRVDLSSYGTSDFDFRFEKDPKFGRRTPL